MIKIDYDTWNRLNKKISELSTEETNATFDQFKSGEAVDQLDEDEIRLLNLGIFLGYAESLKDLGLLVEAEMTGSLYINPKYVEPME